MDPKAPSRLILEWLALRQMSSEPAGPGYVRWRGPDEAPAFASNDDEEISQLEGLYRIDWATDMAGNTRARLDRSPTPVEQPVRARR